MDSRNSDTTASSGRELYHLQLSLQAPSPETSEYTLVHKNLRSVRIRSCYIYVYISVSKAVKGVDGHEMFCV